MLISVIVFSSSLVIICYYSLKFSLCPSIFLLTWMSISVIIILNTFFFFDTTLISVLSSSFSDVLSCYHNITNSSVSLRVLILCALLFIRFGSFHFPVLEKWPYPGDAWRAQQHTPGPALQAPGGDPSVGCVAGPAIGDQLVGGVGP